MSSLTVSEKPSSLMSVSELVEGLSAELWRKILLRSFGLLGLMGVATLLLSQQFAVERIVSGLAPQLGYWIQVGDEFQLRRSMAALTRGSLFHAAQVFDSNGNSILIHPPRKGVSQYVSSPLRIQFQLDEGTPVLWKCAQSVEQGHDAGTLCVGVAPPVSQVLAMMSVMALLLVPAMLSWKRGFRVLANRVSDPWVQLRSSLISAHPADPAGTLRGERVFLREAEDLRTAYLDLWEQTRGFEEERRRMETVRAVAELAEQVSHDIRAPLAALRVVSQGLSSLPVDEKNLILSAVGRILGISQQLRSRHLISPVERHNVSLARLIDEVLRETRACHKERPGLVFMAKINPDDDLVVRGIDMSDLKRALSNLLNNAVEALSGDGGTVEVGAMRVQNGVTIQVADTGKGIPRNVLQQLGRRGATFGKVDGTGLGLYQAKRLAEQAGGRLDIDSTEGRGTVVKMLLPYNAEVAEAALNYPN